MNQRRITTKHSLCDCPNCRNFYVQVREKYPLLAEILSDFGVDISRPDELGGIETDSSIDYLFAAYTVNGKILQSDKHEINLSGDETFLSIVIHNNYYPNNQITEDYFTVTVYGIQLPWILGEPYPETASKKTIFDKVKTLFRKK